MLSIGELNQWREINWSWIWKISITWVLSFMMMRWLWVRWVIWIITRLRVSIITSRRNALVRFLFIFLFAWLLTRSKSLLLFLVTMMLCWSFLWFTFGFWLWFGWYRRLGRGWFWLNGSCLLLRCSRVALWLIRSRSWIILLLRLWLALSFWWKWNILI